MIPYRHTFYIRYIPIGSIHQHLCMYKGQVEHFYVCHLVQVIPDDAVIQKTINGGMRKLSQYLFRESCRTLNSGRQWCTHSATHVHVHVHQIFSKTMQLKYEGACTRYPWQRFVASNFFSKCSGDRCPQTPPRTARHKIQSFPSILVIAFLVSQEQKSNFLYFLAQGNARQTWDIYFYQCYKDPIRFPTPVKQRNLQSTALVEW